MSDTAALSSVPSISVSIKSWFSNSFSSFSCFINFAFWSSNFFCFHWSRLIKLGITFFGLFSGKITLPSSVIIVPGTTGFGASLLDTGPGLTCCIFAKGPTGSLFSVGATVCFCSGILI